MSFHWKVLVWMFAGLAVGLGMQWTLEAPAWAGITFEQHPEGVQVTSLAKGGPGAKAKLASGDVFVGVVLRRGGEDEERMELTGPQAWSGPAEGEAGDSEPTHVLSKVGNGEVVWLVRPAKEGQEPLADAVAVAVTIDPDSPRAVALAPFTFVGDNFLALLKMLIVPLVLSSIVTGVAGVGTMKDLRRLGGKTFLYYVASSLLAILVGQMLVNTIRPGSGAELGLNPPEVAGAGVGTDESFIGVIKRAVPSNIFDSLGDNGSMLSIIFFALMLGFFITRAGEHGERVKGLFESFFAVMMKMAEGVLSLLPYGVFALIVKVTAATGFAPFKALLLYMLTVALALVVHACLTLPMLLKLVGGLDPRRWFKAMSPALMTAFSTSSSSMTLPVTLRTVEQRGRVSNKVTSFTLPLGATINMDGTALYECIGVVFLAQYYASISDFSLTMGDQAFIVVLALLASIGAAGIPSAGLVMMLTILSALKLPVEGAALLLAVDRPLDMMRTTVNVWSDSCGAAIIARTEGEEGPLAPVTAGAAT